MFLKLADRNQPLTPQRKSRIQRRQSHRRRTTCVKCVVVDGLRTQHQKIWQDHHLQHCSLCQADGRQCHHPVQVLGPVQHRMCSRVVRRQALVAVAVAMVEQGRQLQAGATSIKMTIDETAHVRGAGTRSMVTESIVTEETTIGLAKTGAEIGTETTAETTVAVTTRKEGIETTVETTVSVTTRTEGAETTSGGEMAVMTRTEGAEIGIEILWGGAIMNRRASKGDGGEIEIEGKGAGREKEKGEIDTLDDDERQGYFN